MDSIVCLMRILLFAGSKQYLYQLLDRFHFRKAARHSSLFSFVCEPLSSCMQIFIGFFLTKQKKKMKKVFNKDCPLLVLAYIFRIFLTEYETCGEKTSGLLQTYKVLNCIVGEEELHSGKR